MRTKQAKQEIAKREEQIVALRLRHHSFAAIGRVVGISKQSAQRAYFKALRRNTDQDISTHHRSELAELDAQQAKLWTVVDNPKESSKNLIAAVNAMNRIHIRRARLLGLDAPTKLDVWGLYRTGADEISAERLENQCAWAMLPVNWLLLYGLSFSGRYLSSSIKPQSRTNQNGKANHERPQESA
jgi:hypothetical protein